MRNKTVFECHLAVKKYEEPKKLNKRERKVIGVVMQNYANTCI